MPFLPEVEKQGKSSKAEDLTVIREAGEGKRKSADLSTCNVFHPTEGPFDSLLRQPPFFDSKRNSQKNAKKVSFSKKKILGIEERNSPKMSKQSNPPLLRSRSGRIRRINKNYLSDSQNQKDSNSPSKVSCKCSNTKCIKLYCVCFKKDQYCGSACECSNCLNLPEDNQIRETVKKVLVNTDGLSYSKRFKSAVVKVKNEEGKIVDEGTTKLHRISKRKIGECERVQLSKVQMLEEVL